MHLLIYFRLIDFWELINTVIMNLILFYYVWRRVNNVLHPIDNDLFGKFDCQL